MMRRIPWAMVFVAFVLVAQALLPIRTTEVLEEQNRLISAQLRPLQPREQTAVNVTHRLKKVLRQYRQKHFHQAAEQGFPENQDKQVLQEPDK